MRVAFLFPGQGSQQPYMLHNLPQHQLIDETLEEASDVLGENILLWDSKEALDSTIAVQVSLLIASVAAARLLEEEGAQPDMVAGHSVGAFGAAVISKALDFRDAIALVKLRGELMEKAYPSRYGMGVVIGLQERKIISVLNENMNAKEPVFIANINSPSQIVISGSIKGIKTILSAAEKEGARKTELLNVSVPSHCELLEDISSELTYALNTIQVQAPIVPFASNRTARALRDPQSIKEDLAMSVSHPVRWHDATSLFYEMDARLFVELPPGHVLTDLATQSFPHARSISVANTGIRTTCILVNRIKETDS